MPYMPMPSIEVMVPVGPHRCGLAGPLLPQLRHALQRRGSKGREVLLQVLRNGLVVVLQEGRGTWVTQELNFQGLG